MALTIYLTVMILNCCVYRRDTITETHFSSFVFSGSGFLQPKATLTTLLLEQQQVNYVDESLHHVTSWGDAHYMLSPKSNKKPMA